MKNKLEVAIIQSDIVWENPIENRKNFTDKITAISSEIDLIVLPEMFTTGFTMNASKFSETMQGKTVLWMQEMALKKQCALVGSCIIYEEEKYYNRLFFVKPSGKIAHYDKHHLFTLAGEHKVYSKGLNRLLVDFRGWKICPLICYDLRFPRWSRNTVNYDLLLYIASWPKARISAWNTLLKARAIENMTYCIGVNRIGEDKNAYEYSGNSVALDYFGNELVTTTAYKEEISFVTLNKKSQDTARNKFSFLKDQD